MFRPDRAQVSRFLEIGIRVLRIVQGLARRVRDQRILQLGGLYRLLLFLFLQANLRALQCGLVGLETDLALLVLLGSRQRRRHIEIWRRQVRVGNNWIGTPAGS